MPSGVRGYALGAVRIVLVVAGAVVAAGSVHALLTIPPPPPDSEGFVTGMAYIVGGVILVLSLGAAGLGVALPAVVGADDPLGFGRYQRGLLKVAGGLFVGGFLVGVVVAVALAFELGALLWIGAILVGAFAVSVVLAWRLAEAARDALVRAAEGAE